MLVRFLNKKKPHSFFFFLYFIPSSRIYTDDVVKLNSVQLNSVERVRRKQLLHYETGTEQLIIVYRYPESSLSHVLVCEQIHNYL